MSRGNEQKEIFKSRRDREQFLGYLETATTRYGAVFHSYCLMNNHYHLLLETPEGNLSQIMRHINGAYTTYFNTKRKRAGHLFQGRFKAILIEADEYALELSRYIHLNPVQAGMVETPEQYEWASYSAYVGIRQTEDWLCREFIWNLVGGIRKKAAKNYRGFVESGLDRPCENPLKNVIASNLLGSPDFVSEITERFLNDQTDQRNLQGLKHLSVRPDPAQIKTAVDQSISDQALARQIGMYCCRQYSRVSLKRIGEIFGVSDAGVSIASRRMAGRLKNDKGLRDVVDAIAVDFQLLNVEI